MLKPITLTLVFETREQAIAMLELYGEITADSDETSASDGHVTATNSIPEYVPVPHPNPVPGYEQTTELDERGVPWHADHHSSSKKINAKGAWDRRRGHVKTAADAYEAQFLGKPSTAAALAQAPAATMANTAAPSVAPPQPTLVTLIDFQNLWVQLCQQNKVTGADQQYIIDSWGAHPMVEDGHWNDGLRRSQAYAFLRQKANA